MRNKIRIDKQNSKHIKLNLMLPPIKIPEINRAANLNAGAELSLCMNIKF
jgi:hypothetical protein